jgi:serine/threonine protein kinase
MEEARFILRTLLRDDLFGDRVRLSEAERVIDGSISLNFADYCGFLNKYGYVRVDQLTNLIEVTEGGSLVATSTDDAEFASRIQRHFARELGTALVRSPLARAPNAAVPSSAPAPTPAPTAESSPPRARPSAEVQNVAGLEEVLDRRYRRGAAIGSGPIGTVFEAEHIALGRPVAIKEARAIFQFVSYLKRDEIVRRLRAAVQKHALLIHPAIVQIMDQNHEREFPYFVMEHAPGGSLRRRMGAAPEGRLALPQAIRILIQLCYALKYAHGQGILHLGLKPENVLFDAAGNVKLTDFGFSRVMERDDEGSEKAVFISSGTVGYMAPERIQTGGEPRRVGAAADIYALGILIYEMLTGKLPGRRSPLPSQARKDVPETFDDVFDRMTRDELSERYASIDQVLAGIYRAFPATEVFHEGTILLWSADPQPLPEETELAPEPESESPALDSGPAGLGGAAGLASVPNGKNEPDEVKTGEIELASALPEENRPRPVPTAPRSSALPARPSVAPPVRGSVKPTESST